MKKSKEKRGCRLHRRKTALLVVALLVVAAVSLWRPEYAENVAQAFMLLLAGIS